MIEVEAAFFLKLSKQRSLDVTYPELAHALLEYGERDVAAKYLKHTAFVQRAYLYSNHNRALARICSDLQSVKITR